MEPVNASAPKLESSCKLAAFLPIARTFSPRSSNFRVITLPIFPVAPTMVYIRAPSLLKQCRTIDAFALIDYQRDPLQRRDVLDRIAIDQKQIGFIALLHKPHPIRGAQQLRSTVSCRL